MASSPVSPESRTRQGFLWELALLVLSLQASAAQLSTNAAAFNPFSGQGVPPDGIPFQEFPVNTYVGTTNLVAISESTYTFTVNLFLLLYFQDARTMPMIMGNYSSCEFYCASKMSTILNEYGEPACCDGVYIPQAYTFNAVEFAVQTFPYRYAIFPYGNETVVYFTQMQATFSTPFDYAAYPFDSHYLNMDIITNFLPVLPTETLSGAGFSVIDGKLIQSQFEDSGDPVFQPGAYRPAITDVNCAGWELQETWLDVMNWTVYLGSDPENEYAHIGALVLGSPGMRVYLKVARANKPFYVVILILPTALITLFSFVIFFFPMTSQKARIQLTVTLFLTLIILQFTLQQFLPGTFTMISPVYLVLVSYIYMFIMLVISVLSPIILRQYHRRSQAALRDQTRNDFHKFRAALLAGQRPGLTKQDFHEQTSLKIQRIIDTHAPLNGGAPPVQAAAEKQPLCDPSHADGGGGKEGFAPALQAIQHNPEDIDDSTWDWYEGKQRHWYFRNIAPLRLLMMWYHFIGQSTSKTYLEYICHRFEVISRWTLFLGYLLAAGLIFGLAATNDDPSRVLNRGQITSNELAAG